ncbi:ATP-binding protein [Olsenella uli]|nr:ATP-binding protein [Olsenella uli]
MHSGWVLIVEGASARSGMATHELVSRGRSKRSRPSRLVVPGASGDSASGSSMAGGHEEMLPFDFVGRVEGLVYYGPRGWGKTHVATALGVEATWCEIPTRFCEAAPLAAEASATFYKRHFSPLPEREVGRTSRALAHEWRYDRVWESEADRAGALPAYLEHYN